MQLSLFPPDPTEEKKPASFSSPGLPREKPAFRPGRGSRIEVSMQKDVRIKLRTLLEPHLPEGSLEFVIGWFLDRKVSLHITRSRHSKLGDYRSPGPGLPARITVNHNLNKYSFLITLVHEMAHHMVQGDPEGSGRIIPSRRKKRPRPHGPEWQSQYRKLMAPLLNNEILPAEIIHSMKQYLDKPKASTAADTRLHKVLKQYDQPDGSEIIENLPLNAVFRIRNGLIFHKKEKARKRYRCFCVNNGKTYLFNPMAPVHVIREEPALR